MGQTRTLEQVIKTWGPKAERRFKARCEQIRIGYPPARLKLLAFKTEKRLEVWGAGKTGRYHFLTFYPILAASGTVGPKQIEGDLQVPEGFYRLNALNPNSRFHLSIKIDYPNQDDIQRSAVPRHKMGGDIFIHGSNVSIGCIAIGDNAIEELFCLAAQVPSKNREIWISPVDFRQQPKWQMSGATSSVQSLHRRLKTRLKEFIR